MPELPEVETLRGDLSKEVVGKKVKACAVTNGRAVRRHKNAKAFRDLIEGRTLKSVDRLGKYLLIGLDDGNTLVIHLGMSGQLHRAKTPKTPKIKHTHVTFTFTQGGELWFVDPRTFGELFISVVPSAEDQAATHVAESVVNPEARALRRRIPELAELGCDPVESMLTWEQFGFFLHRKQVQLKAFLMDQHMVCGIGNVYSDEIMFAAGLRYDRLTSSLSTTEVRRLYRATVEILAEAIKHRGSSLADEQYRDLEGKTGNYSQFHEVYDRAGLACRRCRNTITKVKWKDRTTYLCEHCQI